MRRRGPVFALVAMALLVVGIGAAVVKRMNDAAEVNQQPVKPVVAVQAPPAVPPVLVIDTLPPGAMLVVDGVERGPSPQTLEALGVGEHQVQASLEGFQPSTRAVTLSRPGERVMVEVAMTAVPVPVVEPVAVVKTPPVGVRPPIRRPPPVAAAGKLTLKTTPWTTVFLGKKKLGDTPLLNVPLPAGKHLLRLINPESNAENSIEVEIKPNETTVKKLKF